MGRETILMVADSERDANMLFAVGFFVPDPFIYLQLKGKSHVILNDLEIDRARKQAPKCVVLSLSRLLKSLREEGVKKPGLPEVVQRILRKHRIKRVTVSHAFPHGFARRLRELKIKVKIKAGSLFPEREIKSSEEVKKVSAALLMAEVGLAEAIQVLKRARIGKGKKLFHHNLPLTSDKLRSVIDTAILQAGGLPSHTIVAGGKQACDPHEPGHGPLRANEPIILDVFPRSQQTGYFGDITRTVVRGRASESARRLYHTVLRGQELALRKISHNTPAADVHDEVQQFFEREGFKTGRKRGHMEGFFHGTGHGLGLEIHEPPRVNATSEDILKGGHVVTVEPGLYYPEIGGVRLEDVAWVTHNTPKNLTKFEKVLEL